MPLGLPSGPSRQAALPGAHRLLLAGLPLLLSACAAWAPAGGALPRAQAARDAAREALPAQPAQPGPQAVVAEAERPDPAAQALSEAWWSQFDDPLLLQLQAEARSSHPNLAAAALRVAQARAQLAQASSAQGPQAGVGVRGSRGAQTPALPLSSYVELGTQASWEFDWFGGLEAAARAAELDATSAALNLQHAQTALNAEVASTYIALRACEAALQQGLEDARSRGETARVAGESARVGFLPPANAELARAGAAQARAAADATRAQCAQTEIALALLSGRELGALQRALAPGQARLPRPQRLDAQLWSQPAAVLTQRADVAAAERALSAAVARVAVADAARKPRVSLNGTLGLGTIRSRGATVNGPVWTLGPVSITMPLWEGGALRAQLAAAEAGVHAAGVQYRAAVQAALLDVERALSALAEAERGLANAQAAQQGYAASQRAVEARFQYGMASVFELEEARRTTLAAQRQVLELQRQRAQGWVDLYRALGGGWSQESAPGAAGGHDAMAVTPRASGPAAAPAAGPAASPAAATPPAAGSAPSLDPSPRPSRTPALTPSSNPSLTPSRSSAVAPSATLPRLRLAPLR